MAHGPSIRAVISSNRLCLFVLVPKAEPVNTPIVYWWGDRILLDWDTYCVCLSKEI